MHKERDRRFIWGMNRNFTLSALIILNFSTTISPKLPIFPVYALHSEMQLTDDFDKAWRREGLFEMMSKEDQKILKEFSSRVRSQFSDARVWAFGSRARGEATW